MIYKGFLTIEDMEKEKQECRKISLKWELRELLCRLGCLRIGRLFIVWI